MAGNSVNVMNRTRTCGRCGAEVPDFAPDRLCLHCLFDSAYDPEQLTPSERVGIAAGAHSSTASPLSATFGEYELLGELGRGGQGVVYRARHRLLGRVVALKAMPPTGLTSAGAGERFRLEAVTASRLEHPHIVPIHEVGERDGFSFYSMKLMEGGTIERALESVTMESERVRLIARLMVRVASAVHYAHQRGVLHRDLKPSNILLDAELEPHVADFGLARWVEHDSSLTLSHAIIGTAAYVAPEIARDGASQATTASDIYGLGAILYELLAGHPPFTGKTLAEILRKVQEEEPRLPKEEGRRKKEEGGFLICDL
jgi:eukaryotic-like serine/threonine-protein kinase